ncbi:cbb3-type cytochrome c oxidase subunit I [Thiocapsa sp.]|uniref:cbb3-type cytochrome c oxidase subunit I n=1 Tax=Thiocapsa sp. TaxID=2024551 RepID=UPI0025CF979A|nr:cbb3-type cytochrome c oxidase subunit I [Thiocapsa sp.]
MTTTELRYATPEAQRAPVVKLYLGIGLLVFAGLMLVGALMRAAQGATMLTLAPDVFYQLMTLHGAGMVGTAGLAALAVNWYFLSQHVQLNPKIFLATLLLSLVAVAMIVGSILIGHFAAAWTFLYPLPAFSLGQWSKGAALTFVGGLLLLGVAFLLVYLDMGVAIVRRYGSIARALGLPMLFGREPIDATHSPTVVASAMVLIVNVAGIAVGAIVLIMTMLHLIYPALAPDALLMKNLIFFFGHVFINATIYSAVIAVYEILPLYARRPWRVSRPFLAAWLAVTLMVLAVYPHHLLMDFAMPPWMAIMGQIVSYASGIPVLVMTAFGGLMLVYRSGIRWDAASSLLVLSLFGWAAGIIPAVIDGMIHVNLVMHNTLWVPGHFHFYLLLGVLPMVLGFASYLCANGQQGRTGLVAVAVYATGGTLLCLSFLVSGALSVPRRFAVHEESWQWLGNVGALSGGIVLIGTLMIAVPILQKLPRARLASTGIGARA